MEEVKCGKPQGNDSKESVHGGLESFANRRVKDSYECSGVPHQAV